MTDNVESIAWTGECPWHSLGSQVSNDLSVEEMQVASGTDWTVFKAPLFAHLYPLDEVGAGHIRLPEMALIRDKDNSVLDIVGEDWIPKQNSEAFAFFKEFVEKGDMKMETAGSLQNGKIVWVLAKVGNGFTLFGGDKVESYLLFTNPHKYGMSIDVRFTSIRVVCNNTLTMALNGKANNVFKASHRVEITNEAIQETLGIVETKMEQYKENVEFLGSMRYSQEAIADYFDEVFPLVLTVKDRKREAKKVSKSAGLALQALTHQPGLEFAPGSWWQGLNAVTYVTDHLMGRSDDARVHNSWYGQTKDLKLKAMKLALEYAKNS